MADLSYDFGDLFKYEVLSDTREKFNNIGYSMAALRRWTNKHNDMRKFFGAIAAPVITEETKKHVLNSG